MIHGFCCSIMFFCVYQFLMLSFSSICCSFFQLVDFFCLTDFVRFPLLSHHHCITGGKLGRLILPIFHVVNQTAWYFWEKMEKVIGSISLGKVNVVFSVWIKKVLFPRYTEADGVSWFSSDIKLPQLWFSLIYSWFCVILCGLSFIWSERFISNFDQPKKRLIMEWFLCLLLTRMTSTKYRIIM